MAVLGAVIFLIGITILVAVSRRKFYRRNSAGVEEFKSFSQAAGTTAIEGLALLVGRLGVGIGVLVFVVGLFVH